MLATDLSYSQLLDREAKGIPIGRVPEVNLRNTHAQYIFTWYVLRCRGSSPKPFIRFGSALTNVPIRYGLAAATSIMFWMVAKKPTQDPSRRVRMNKHW